MAMRKSIRTLLLLSALCAVPQRAQASGFASPALAPSSAGVSTTDVAAMAYNPGAIGFLEQAQIVGGGAFVLADLRYQRTRLATYQYQDSLDFDLPIDPALIDSNKHGSDVAVSDRPFGLVGSVYGAVPIGKLPLVVGFGANVPNAAMLHLPKSGPQRFQITDAFIATGQLTPTVAYRPIKQLSMGLGLSYVLGYASISKMQDLATLNDLGQALANPPINQSNSFGPNADPGVRELDTMARPFKFQNGIANGFTFSTGITAEVMPDLFVAASYQHTTKLTFRGNFQLNMNDPFFTQDLASQGLKYAPQVKGDASLSFVLPRSVRFGVRYGFGKKIGGERKINLALEGSYTGWSSVQNFDVRIKSPDLAQPALGLPSSTGLKLPRYWKDTYGAIARVRYVLTSELALWGSAGVESGASPNRTIDMASPDGTRILAAAGLSQRVSDHMRLILDAQMQAVLQRRVVTSDYDLGNGTYSMRIVALGAYLDYTF
jgi:long-chain fatty acid transport protein